MTLGDTGQQSFIDSQNNISVFAQRVFNEARGSRLVLKFNADLSPFFWHQQYSHKSIPRACELGVGVGVSAVAGKDIKTPDNKFSFVTATYKSYNKLPIYTYNGVHISYHSKSG